jgi:tyrosine-protein kinase Etk/Wzc
MITDTQRLLSVQRELGSQDNPDSIADKLSGLFRYWPFFLISLFICVCLAYAFLRSSTPLYTVYAKILINNENPGQNVKQNTQETINPKKVNDEIEILRSREIMEKVVKNLQLWTRYYDQSDLEPYEIYSSKPVTFTLIKPDAYLNGQTIVVTIKDEHTFYLKQANSLSTFDFGEQLTSSFGSWKLNATADLKNFVGRTIAIQLNDPDEVTDGFLFSFGTLIPAEQSSIVQLSMRETVPERGADIINGTIQAYNLASIEYKNKVSQSTLTFLDGRLDSITSELNHVEKRVEKYKSSRGITDLSAKSQYYLENVKGNDSHLNEVNVQLQIINEIQKYINSPTSNGNAPATTGISDPGLIALIDQLIRLESQKDRLLSTTPDKNPIFVPINRQINTTKNAIRENIKGIKRSYVATRNQLQKYNVQFEQSIKKLPGQEREFITIKRQQSIKEELYIFLLQKREEAGMDNASKLLESRIIDKAHFGAPEIGNANFTYALAIIFGLVLPAGVLLTKDALNNKVASVKEIERMVYAPIIGEVSYQKSQAVIVSADASRSMISEQFRIIRTKLSHINGRDGNGKVTLLTSGMPGEGKSMISRNLGAVMAAAGRKTVIIDADLRKPQVATVLNLTNDIGLSNYLNGNAFKENIVQASNVHPQLFVIAAGSEAANPSELLEKPAMGELFDWLRLYFDEIIIDTPPIQLVTDALILTTFCDSMLYVLRQGYTYKSQFKFINQLYKEENSKSFHIVFNGVSAVGTYSYPEKYTSQYFATEKPKFRIPFLGKN